MGSEKTPPPLLREGVMEACILGGRLCKRSASDWATIHEEDLTTRKAIMYLTSGNAVLSKDEGKPVVRAAMKGRKSAL